MPERPPPLAGPAGGLATGDQATDTASPVPGGNRRRARFSPFRLIVVLVLVAAAVSAWLLTRPSTPAYRTAEVGTGTAVATLASVGTVTPVNQADLSFAVAGTVGDVNVTVGQQVTAGEVVASLETTPLENAIVAANASLASAQATLASDEASQAAASAASSASSASSASPTGSTGTSGSSGAPSSAAPAAGAAGTTPTTTPPKSGGTSTASSEQVAKLQATLVADQKRLDSDSAAAGAALAQASTLCVTPSSPGVTPAAPGATGAPSGGAPSGVPPSGSGPGHPATTCSGALSQASATQAAVAADITTVQKDEAALNAALGATGSGSTTSGSPGRSSGAPGEGQSGTAATTTTTTIPVTTTTRPASTTAASSGTPSGGSSVAGTGASKGKVVTPEKLALDQADIDVAQTTLANDQEALADANLVSTISGTVGSVTVTGGQSVQAGSPSGTPQVVVVGSGSSYQVATTVPVTSISKVAVGQQALVTPDSIDTVLDGKVTAIGVLGTSSSTSTTYPVTVSLDSPDLGLFSGAEATVSIVTRRAVDVTTVPTSAVHTIGTNHLVTVVDGSRATSVPVKVGTVGAELTQIISGVTVGQRVSLAAMDQPVPTSSTTTRAGLSGLGGAVTLGGGGGGFGGGGFSPGAFRQVAGG